MPKVDKFYGSNDVCFDQSMKNLWPVKNADRNVYTYTSVSNDHQISGKTNPSGRFFGSQGMKWLLKGTEHSCPNKEAKTVPSRLMNSSTLRWDSFKLFKP
jgi:hypothetical protein